VTDLSRKPHPMYAALVTSPGLDRAGQERIFHLAKTARKYDLLAALALRDDLCPALDDRLKDVDAAVVRAAWLARPGRTADEVAELGHDNRDAVLSAVAGLPGLHDATYRFAANSDSAPAHWSLLANPAAPAAQRFEAGRRIARTVTRDGFSHQRLEVLLEHVRNLPGLASEIILNTRSVKLKARLVTDPHLTRQAVNALYNGLLQFIKDAPAAQANPSLKNRVRDERPDWKSILTRLAGSAHGTPAQAAALCAALVDENGRQRPESVTGLPDSLTGAEVGKLAAKARSRHPGELVEAATSPDEDYLRHHATRAIIDRDVALGIALASNRNTPVEAIRAVRAELFDLMVPEHVLTAQAGNYPALAVLLQTFIDGIKDTDLERVDDPGKVQLAYIRRCTQLREKPGRHTLESRHMSREHLLAMPAKGIWHRDFERVAPDLVELVTADLTTAEQWSAFDGLVTAEEDRPLGECLEVVHLLLQDSH
jgi:hypothetical protein